MDLETAAHSIICTLQEHGFKAYLCGGCVRDKLLGLAPKDYDIVTNAEPEAIRKVFRRTLAVGVQFGVVRVKQTEYFFEVATFRKDGKYIDGRRPQSVQFCDEIEDARRRDFTINGLFYDVKTENIVDYVEGQKDLKRKVIQTIGNPEERFGEDYLRMMRAIRFACQLNFEMENATWETLKKKASCIISVSKERIRDELLSMLTGTNPTRAVTLLRESGLLAVILPELNILDAHSWEHILDMFQKASRISSPELAIGILLLGLTQDKNLETRPSGKQSVKAICRRLRLSNKSREQVISLVESQPQFFRSKSMGFADLKKFLRIPDFDEHLKLHKLNCLAYNQSLDNYEFCQFYLNKFTPQMLFPPPLIDGTDLIRMGLSPGPDLKKFWHCWKKNNWKKPSLTKRMPKLLSKSNLAGKGKQD